MRLCLQVSSRLVFVERSSSNFQPAPPTTPPSNKSAAFAMTTTACSKLIKQEFPSMDNETIQYIEGNIYLDCDSAGMDCSPLPFPCRYSVGQCG